MMKENERIEEKKRNTTYEEIRNDEIVLETKMAAILMRNNSRKSEQIGATGNKTKYQLDYSNSFVIWLWRHSR